MNLFAAVRGVFFEWIASGRCGSVGCRAPRARAVWRSRSCSRGGGPRAGAVAVARAAIAHLLCGPHAADRDDGTQPRSAEVRMLRHRLAALCGAVQVALSIEPAVGG